MSTRGPGGCVDFSGLRVRLMERQESHAYTRRAVPKGRSTILREFPNRLQSALP